MAKGKQTDQHRLRAAEGWLELGGADEALRELSHISSANASSIEVLRTRYSALAASEQWEFALLVSEVALNIFPACSEVWLWRAHAIRVLSKNAAKARDALSPASDRFPDDPIILLNLALYERELGDSAKALIWLEKARRAAQTPESLTMVRQLVEQDVQLGSLWNSIEARTCLANRR